MPYDSTSDNSKINVSQSTNNTIDRAHLEFMAKLHTKISKRDFIARLVEVGLQHENELIALFPKGEKIPA